MKRLWTMIALGAALGLSVTFTSVSANAGGKIANDNAAYDLTVQAEFDHDELGDSELKGTLFNTSVVNAYDDVVLNVDFFDDQNVLIDTQYFTLDEDLEAGEDEDFRVRIQAPEGTESASWMISSAEDE
jgi:uncharacterized membrane protein